MYVSSCRGQQQRSKVQSMSGQLHKDSHSSLALTMYKSESRVVGSLWSPERPIAMNEASEPFPIPVCMSFRAQESYGKKPK